MLARPAAARTTSQSTLGDIPSPQTRPAFVDRAEQDTVRDTRSDRPFIDSVLDPYWNRHSPDVLGLADQVGDHPVIFPQLN